MKGIIIIICVLTLFSINIAYGEQWEMFQGKQDIFIYNTETGEIFMYYIFPSESEGGFYPMSYRIRIFGNDEDICAYSPKQLYQKFDYLKLEK